MSWFLYTLIPVVAAIVGASVAAYRPPAPVLVSAIQHFAAGVVFAAAAGEILPDLKHGGSLWAIAIGGTVGIVLMLGLKRLEERVGGAVGLLALVGVDILIDGLVLGIGFAAGAKVGLLLTIALTIEVLFLGLTVAAEIGESERSRGQIVLLTGALALLLPIGALLALPIAGLSAPILAGFFAFGLIALLYLVTEELLVEAHEIPDQPWVTAMFFVGFLILLILDEAIG
ncbi:ZIP family metal transporter [Mesorhizobium sp. Mes31]|uniref:ZIP family metal transporter n=1 Tax=Mesorhizobium sp. Mes31 TaxID=2926017 RepID=UPI002119AC27|nr:transporter [Mesorhizobium sp. Mes31]